MTTVVEVRYVLLTGFQLQPISEINKLQTACNRKDAAQKKTVKVTLLDHKVIMEEAGKRDQLEYNVDNDNDSDESKEEVRRRARRRASRAMVSSSRATMAKRTRRMMVIIK